MKTFFYTGLFVLFCLYWCVTVFFMLPKNPLNLTMQRSKEVFHSNFFQRWSFFAPPPDYNQKVYVVFKNKRTQKSDVFEILTPITNAKTQTAPFNAHYQIIDYVMASTLINIDGNIRLLQDVFKHKNNLVVLKEADSTITKTIVDDIEKTSDFKTLSNYAKKIALENTINPSEVAYRIQIVKFIMPQFVDRFSGSIKQEISFSSHLLDFKNYEKNQ